MSETLKLAEVGYDSLEGEEYKNDIGIFTEGDGLTAYGKIQQWLGDQPPKKLYMGSIIGIPKTYPQYEVTPIKVF